MSPIVEYFQKLILYAIQFHLTLLAIITKYGFPINEWA